MSFKIPDYRDLINRQPVILKDSSYWTCRDVALIDDERNNSLFYILENDAGSTIKVPIGELAQQGFISERSYDDENAVREMKEEWFRQQELLYREAEAEKLKNMIAKSGEKNGTLIARGTVTLGMTKQMCADAWDATISVVQTPNGETWVYGYRRSLTFSGNQLTGIVNIGLLEEDWNNDRYDRERYYRGTRNTRLRGRSGIHR